MRPAATPAVQTDLSRVCQLAAYHALRIGHPPNAVVEETIRSMTPSALRIFSHEFSDLSGFGGPEFPQAVQERRDHYGMVASIELCRRQTGFVAAVLGCFAETEVRP